MKVDRLFSILHFGLLSVVLWESVAVDRIKTTQEPCIKLADNAGIVRELAGGPRFEGYYSSTGEAMQSGQLSMGQYYGHTALNMPLGGVPDLVQTGYQYYNGEITTDEASKRFGTAGVMGLGGAAGLRGTPLGNLRLNRGSIGQALRTLPSEMKALPSAARQTLADAGREWAVVKLALTA